MNPEEYPETYQASPEELKARNGRNIAIAISLASFMLLVFLIMVTRGGAIS